MRRVQRAGAQNARGQGGDSLDTSGMCTDKLVRLIEDIAIFAHITEEIGSHTIIPEWKAFHVFLEKREDVFKVVTL